MAWRALQSGHLAGANYEEETASLHIQFINGAVYLYRMVPATVADTLFQSSSPGSYFHNKIKGNYQETKIVDGMTRRGRRSGRRY